MKQKKLIGQASPKQRIEIENNDIRRFAACVGSSHPVHFKEEAARAAGFSGLVAPTSMAATFGTYLELISLLEVHPKNVLHSEQTVHLRRPIVAGDVINITSIITDIYERPIGSATTGFVTIEDHATDSKGKQLIFARRVLAVRGGFPRR